MEFIAHSERRLAMRRDGREEPVGSRRSGAWLCLAEAATCSKRPNVFLRNRQDLSKG
jgi:hypothetical protein